ncbi:MAG: ferritin family protein [Planctomycetota bacterium]|jgi:rubrerythrin
MKASKKVLDTIKSGILQEIKARDFYRSIASQLPDGGASLKLSIMADVEEDHRRILTKWYKDLSGQDPVMSDSKKKGTKRLIELPPKNASLKDVVKVIYEAEARAYQFYKDAEDKTEDAESKKIFQKLARMEKSHEEFYRGEYEALTVEASLMFADEDIPWLVEARS